MLVQDLESTKLFTLNECTAGIKNRNKYLQKGLLGHTTVLNIEKWKIELTKFLSENYELEMRHFVPMLCQIEHAFSCFTTQ